MKRIDLLNKLINFDDDIDSVNAKLATFGWDSNEDFVILKKQHLLKVLNKFLNGEIDQNDIVGWAEAIECREDIGFDLENKNMLSQIIFDLANPGVVGELSKVEAKALMEKLSL